MEGQGAPHGCPHHHDHPFVDGDHHPQTPHPTDLGWWEGQAGSETRGTNERDYASKVGVEEDGHAYKHLGGGAVEGGTGVEARGRPLG